MLVPATNPIKTQVSVGQWWIEKFKDLRQDFIRNPLLAKYLLETFFFSFIWRILLFRRFGIGKFVVNLDFGLKLIQVITFIYFLRSPLFCWVEIHSVVQN